uniref:Uncharacterized protein n=1 Tax=Corvus moneduloides TaxID=1196302 RepID=A0A8U7MNT7_CORMO
MAAAALALVAAAAAALGALVMAPASRSPTGRALPGPPRRASVPAEWRRPGRMDQALLLVRNELPAPGLNLAARSGSCHQVRGFSIILESWQLFPVVKTLSTSTQTVSCDPNHQ